VALLESSGAIIYANPAACNILGLNAEDAAGRRLFDLVAHEDLARVGETAASLLSEPGRSVDLVFRVPQPEGLPRWVAAVATNMLDDPAVAGVLVTIRDISEPMQARQELQAREAFLEAVFQAARDAVIAIDSRGRVILWSSAAERMFGYNAAEAMGQDVHKLLAPPGSFALYKRKFPRFSKTGSGPVVGKTVELVARNRAGQPLPVEISLSSFRVADGSWQAVAVVRDVTARKQAEAEMAHQVEVLTALIGSARKLTQSLDLAALAGEVTRICVEILGADLAWLGQAREDGTVDVIAQYPRDHPYPSAIKVRWDDSALGRGPTGRAIRTGKIQIRADLQSARSAGPWRQLQLAHGLASSAAIPLGSGSHVFGALNVYSKTKGYFTPEILGVMEAFANLSAATLENARVVSESQVRLRRLDALRKIDLAITSTLDLRVMLDIVLDQVT
ncbi:MAG: PAS domain S-box protein, partial [Thermoleophilia bacterium]|nr:PAS domain S-box protein [Thermoleophilia bacterium]